ncbi:hypothetical protein E2562_035622 [Oryza meyeriana var. granulata]|uniref:Uncharacterized protein n=1 Tax=Oryza meyeriana var. granulata TaxID=110450 RepID=A0A6G1CBY5_9ORYZ|nr:hypothetical protein E2562_035622 [Oryza meyeriana var. granulata]
MVAVAITETKSPRTSMARSGGLGTPVVDPPLFSGRFQLPQWCLLLYLLCVGAPSLVPCFISGFVHMHGRGNHDFFSFGDDSICALGHMVAGMALITGEMVPPYPSS